MHYALLYYETPEAMARREGPEAGEYWAGWTQYFDVLRNAGVILTGEPLQPGDTKTVVRDGPNGRVIEDGPFADAREELGGFVIIDVEDLDKALAFTEGAPCCREGGHVEVRPVLMRQTEPA